MEAGELFAVNPRHARELEAQIPLPKGRLQRALRPSQGLNLHRSCGNRQRFSDVIVLALPLSRIPEMEEVIVLMFELEMTGTYREPPFRPVIFTNGFYILSRRIPIMQLFCFSIFMNKTVVMVRIIFF